MKENVLDVLVYLFENYYLDEEAVLDSEPDAIHGKLSEAGFLDSEINKALKWLEDLVVMQQHQSLQPSHPTPKALRIYTEQEMDRLDADCRGFLLYLEQAGVLPPQSRELVIERAMALESEDFDIEQLKWVLLMVLFNQPGGEAAYAWIEDLIFEEPYGYLQ